MDISAAMKALGAIKHETRFGEPINSFASDAMEALTGDRDACCTKEAELGLAPELGYVSKEEMVDEHDEAMRMRALAIGVKSADDTSPADVLSVEWQAHVHKVRDWAYHQATGRNW